ncbi:MAG: septum formation protein Maf [Clostridia bacterium]|nr:septum formation protein Maf [Clostridia bacterium]
MKIVLASKSPRRRELLSLICKDFEIRVSDADEEYEEGTPLCIVPRILSERKAMAVHMAEDEIVIGCDTVVLIDNELLGKPKTRERAIEMLGKMSGRCHEVISGLSVRKGDKIYSEAVSSTVYMRKLSDREIEKYVDEWKPLDKAGAYGIQEMAGSFVSRIEGDFYNIVGLPLCRLVEILSEKFGVYLA